MIAFSVPATLANLGPGFDTLGMAISVCNHFRFEARPAGVFEADGVAIDPAEHLCLHTARLASEAFGCPLAGLAVSQDENVPRARGMGSSATARVAGLIAWSRLSGCVPPLDEALAFLAAAEGHADNVVPAMLGGLTLALSDGDHLHPLRLDPPADLRVALVIPNREVSTDAARAILPQELPLSDAIFNLQRVAMLVAGLTTADPRAIALGLDDRLHQPYRAPLIGPVDDAFAAAHDAGAVGAFISGSGSSLAAFVLNPEVNAAAVATAMATPFLAAGIDTHARAVRPLASGAWPR